MVKVRLEPGAGTGPVGAAAGVAAVAGAGTGAAAGTEAAAGTVAGELEQVEGEEEEESHIL